MPIAGPTQTTARRPDEPLSRFESLGGTADFGDECFLVQRAAGLAPHGLLCRAEMPATTLVHLLETRLDGVGGAGNVLIGPWPNSDQWWTRDPRFPLAVRSGLRIADRPLLGLTAQIRRQWLFLRDRLLETLDRNGRAPQDTAVLVFRAGAEDPLPDLDAALRRYPTIRLLWVRQPDTQRPAGVVRVWSDRLLIAALPSPAAGAEPDQAGWRAICQGALALIAGAMPAKTAAPPVPSHDDLAPAGRIPSDPPPVTTPEPAPPAPDEAEDQLRAAVAQSPGSADAHDALARFLMERSRLADAVEAWSAALAITPNDLGRLTNLGGVLFKAGQFAPAAALFQRAATIAPHSIGVANQHLVARQRAGDIAGALAAARHIVVLDPDNPRRLLQLAVVLALAGDLDTAEDVTRQAITMDPKLPESRSTLSDILVRRDRLDAALEAARQALALQPTNTRALGQVGRLAGRLGLYEEAEAALTRAAVLEPAAPTWERLLADLRRRHPAQPAGEAGRRP